MSPPNHIALVRQSKTGPRCGQTGAWSMFSELCESARSESLDPRSQQPGTLLFLLRGSYDAGAEALCPAWLEQPTVGAVHGRNFFICGPSSQVHL